MKNLDYSYNVSMKIIKIQNKQTDCTFFNLNRHLNLLPLFNFRRILILILLRNYTILKSSINPLKHLGYI